jgi:DNA-directed RNA polymerase specialized sigma24 family protein
VTQEQLRPLVSRLFGVARFHGLSTEEAEDVAAEVVARFVQGRIHHEGGCLRAAENLARDHRRRMTGYRSKPRVFLSLDAIHSDAHGEEHHGWLAVAADFSAVEVESFLRKFPPHYRRALEVAMLGLTDRDSAALIGATTSEYKTHLYRARKLAKRLWAESLEVAA